VDFLPFEVFRVYYWIQDLGKPCLLHYLKKSSLLHVFVFIFLIFCVMAVGLRPVVKDMEGRKLCCCLFSCMGSED